MKILNLCQYQTSQPEGLPAISRGLSEATPPVVVRFIIRPWRGRSHRAINNPGYSPHSPSPAFQPTLHERFSFDDVVLDGQYIV